MSEQINILRKLAGLPVQEAAPVQFSGADTDADAKAAKFLPPNASSAKMSIANRFPKGADVNDPKVKQEEFIQALLRSPGSLLAEISERLDPKDNNSLSVDQKVSDIIQLMNQKNISVGNLPTDLKQFVLDLTVNAVKNMELNAGDDSPAFDDMDDEDEFEKESVDLNSIRGDYGIEEDDTGYQDRYAVKNGKAVKDNPKIGGDKKQTHHVYADSPEDAVRKHAMKKEEVETVDEFDQEVKHGNKGRTTEGFSSEADQVLAQVGSGELDAYDVMTRPQGPAQAKAAEIIQSMYDDAVIDHRLHPDDDFEKILDIVADQLASDYGDSDAETREAVDETTSNAMNAALAQLRKLAGLV